MLVLIFCAFIDAGNHKIIQVNKKSVHELIIPLQVHTVLCIYTHIVTVLHLASSPHLYKYFHPSNTNKFL